MKKKNKTIILILILCLTCAANTKFLGAKGDAYKPNQDIIAKEKVIFYAEVRLCLYIDLPTLQKPLN